VVFAEKYLQEEHEWPAGLSERHFGKGLEARSALEQGLFGAAARLFEEQYRLLLEAQPHRRRFHKGESLHNWGLSLIYLGDQERALRETLAAFIEDAASGAENEPDRLGELDGSAAHNLIYVFGTWGPRVAQIAQQVRDSIRAGEELPDPHVLFETADMATAAARPAGTRPLRVIGSVDSPPERRVFIGGNYRRLTETLWPLADRLGAIGYDGLLAADFGTPSGWGSDEVMMPLLTGSHFAVFEVSESGGQIEEIAAVPNTMQTPERVFAVFDRSEAAEPGISHGQTLVKLSRWGVVPIGYDSIDHLERLVTEWLQANQPPAATPQ
jgi:hypothetical protein